jgi:hypothetical protein
MNPLCFYEEGHWFKVKTHIQSSGHPNYVKMTIYCLYICMYVCLYACMYTMHACT